MRVPRLPAHIAAAVLACLQNVAAFAADRAEAWLPEPLPSGFRVVSSPMDGPVFRRWATLMHRRSDTLYEDAMIAATAQVHGLTVVTRNVADFAVFGVPLFNPFD